MKNAFIELLFPRFCLSCGYVGIYLCSRCQEGIPKIKAQSCFYCRKPSLAGLTHPSCRVENGLDGCLSVYSYEGLFSKLLQETKYKGAHLVLSTLLSYFDICHLKEFALWKKVYVPQIVSVPLHPQRVKERGFNQSDIIVRGWFNEKWNTSENILKRGRNTDHLANIGNSQSRKRHIKNAFEYVGSTIPKAAMLVDDMITSGSTIIECAKTLKENGVQTVLAFSLAKG